jgi:hypothetical protein
MAGLLWRILGLAACVVAAVLIYLEGGAAEAPLVVPRVGDVAAAPPPPPSKPLRAVRFFFGGGGAEHRVAGVLHGAGLDQAVALGVPRSSLVATDDGLSFAFGAPAADLVGFAVVMPPGPLRWEWTLDGAPWPREDVFAGPYGLRAPDLANGIGASCAHGFAVGAGTPYFSAHQVGAFVICEDR